MSDIFFVSEAKGRGAGARTGKRINVGTVQKKLGENACRHILTIHAFGGCDTTSAIFGLGKGTVYQRLTKNANLLPFLEVMLEGNASKEEVTSAGVAIMAAACGGKETENLGQMRYKTYCRIVTKNLGRFQAERLPPSENATHFHALRVHMQVVCWATCGSTQLNPEHWGWRVERGRLIPETMTEKPGPPHLMKVIRCNCTTNCSSRQCTCRKNGLKCVSACGNCNGKECLNADTMVVPPVQDIDEVTEELEEVCAEECMTDKMWDEEMCVDRDEDVYDTEQNASACDIFFDSYSAAELALDIEEEVV